MTYIKVSLAVENCSEQQKKKPTTTFWFTSDWSIKLSNHKNPTANVILERLSERSFLELKAAYLLGIVELDRPEIFKAA